MSKVKNVIKGYMSKYDIEEVTFFEDSGVLYSGSYSSFIQTSHEATVLFAEMKRILDAECMGCINHNDTKLFIFLTEIRAEDNDF